MSVSKDFDVRPPGLSDVRCQYAQPTVFADVRNEMRIAQEEIFGPGGEPLVMHANRRFRSGDYRLCASQNARPY